MYAPILVSVYDRLEHLRNCIESLKNCPESLASELYVASDFPVGGNDAKRVDKVRSYIKTITGFKKVVPIFREMNYGSYNNKFQARKYVFEKHDKLIQLEDDVIVGKGFLRFVNDGLDVFADCDKVIGVCGYLPPGVENISGSPFFSQEDRAPYGFGMWRGKERKLRNKHDPDYVESAMCDFRFFKDFERRHPHVARAFPLIVNREIMPGDIMTSIVMQKENLLSLYPPRSITMSKGNDGGGLHTRYNKNLQDQEISDDFFYLDPFMDISIDVLMRKKWISHHKKKGVVFINYLVFYFWKFPFGYSIYKFFRNVVKKMRSIRLALMVDLNNT